MFNWSFKPLDGKFPRPLTHDDLRAWSRFKKTWSAVLDDLERETDNLNARDDSVIIMTAHSTYYIRNDGRLRSDAPNPEHPGVVIRFDVPSDDRTRYVPMSFECDQFTSWKANVQAIAGALEALRKVDRYGVSSNGKTNAHYEGYKALPSAEGKMSTLEEHAAFIATYSGIDRKEILDSETALKVAYRKAAGKLHPDQDGGSHELFSKLCEARTAIEGNNNHA